jgi:hypothetical protein
LETGRTTCGIPLHFLIPIFYFVEIIFKVILVYIFNIEDNKAQTAQRKQKYFFMNLNQRKEIRGGALIAWTHL